MADDKENAGRQERASIDVNEDYELGYWSKKFGISRDELRMAVEQVGPMVKDVERRLGR